MTLAAGQTLSCYEILGPLGAGAMGEVYRARDTRLERDVAIKVLPEEVAADDERLRRFEREAKTLASLNHPNVAQVYGIDEVGDTSFIVLELVPGEDLEARLARGPLPIDEAIDVGRHIAEGLEAAHEAGVVHRDLKPANVRVTPDGTVKLLDFGLAKPGAARSSDSDGAPTATTNSLLATVEGRVLGTPMYMSPEQARGKPVDRRTDVWAFGCVLFECLTGKRAFVAESVSEVLAAVLHEEPDLDALPRGTPPRVRELIARCLAKDPRQRLRDAGEARWALEHAREDGHAPAAGEATRARSRSSRVLYLVAATAIFAAGWWLRPVPPAREPVRVTELTLTGADSQPDVSPDGRLIAFTSSRDGVSRIWLRQVEGGGEQPLTEGTDWRPRFSPNGESVAFVRRDGGTYSAYRVPVVGGRPRKLMENVHEVAWSPDERSLAFLRGTIVGQQIESTLGVFDVQTGDERILARSVARQFAGLSWSAESGRLATVGIGSDRSGSQLLVVDPVDGVTRELAVGDSMCSSPAWVGADALIYAKSSTTVAGSPAPDAIMRLDLRTGREQPLLFESYLFQHPNPFSEGARVRPLGADRLVFDTYRPIQTIEVLDRSGVSTSVLMDSVAIDRQPAYSPDGSKLLFTSNRSGNMDLFTYDLATGRVVQLTDDPGSDWDGTYAPDGGSILWGAERSGHLEIWMADADGANPRQVSHDGVNAENPTMTADGGWIVYTSGNAEHPGIHKVRPDGSDATHLVAAGSNAEVSPDGRFVAFRNGDAAGLRAEIRVAELATGDLVDFRIVIIYGPGSPSVTYGRCRWLPDGSAIAFVGVDDDEQPALWIQDFAPGRDTSATRRRVAGVSEAGIIESFGISPDGQHFAIATLRSIRSLKLAEGLPALRSR